MTVEQLNKLQIKAEVLTVLSKLQTNIDAVNVDEILKTLAAQEDKRAILDVLVKELTKSNEQKTILISFMALKLCEKNELENALWDVLKSPAVADSTKTIILNVLKDMGNKVDYDKMEQFFDNPEEVIDADTQRLLQVAIINPEAQIDFLDFINSLSEVDKKLLVESLGDDYSSDDLANILNPLVLYTPTSELGKTAIEVLGSTKSQLALHTLLETLDFVDDEEVLALVKKNISKLKISGVREDNAEEFYKSVLSSKPYQAYTSYPDGHGNQALIFSRIRDEGGQNGSMQMVATVINDTYGVLDCFGFNEISQMEFERIVSRFYNGDEHVYLDSHVIKSILAGAEKITRKNGYKIPYEYICWRNLLSDITAEAVPVELNLKSQFEQNKLTDEELEKVYMLDFVQRWFFDTDYSNEFKALVENLNAKIGANDFNIDLEAVVQENLNKIFSVEQKNLLDKRILMSAYLKYLSGNKNEAQLVYSLYLDEEKKSKLTENIIRKSIYEYYVTLKFKYKEEHKMTNIFAMKNKQKSFDLTEKQINSAIALIEKTWVK